MSGQQDLLELIVESREKAIKQVDKNANTEWKDIAYSKGYELAKVKHYFTSEDVWEGLSDSDSSTHEPRAMGPVMRRLQRDGFIVATSQFTVSTSPLGHGRPSRVWKSLIGGEQA